MKDTPMKDTPMKDREVAYVIHPVTADQKSEFVAAGMKIMNARFASEGATIYNADMSECAPESVADDDPRSDDELRFIIADLAGKEPRKNAKRETLLKKVAGLECNSE